MFRSWVNHLTIDRSVVFGFMFFLAAANGLVPRVLTSINKFGMEGAVGALFGISAVILFALFALYSIATEPSDPQPLHKWDIWVLGLMTLLIIVPYYLFASLGLFAGSAYLFATSAQGSNSRRLAIVALALTGTLLWGPVLLRVFGVELLYLDTKLMSLLSGIQHSSNMFWSVDGTQRYIVAGSCASLANISLAIVLMASLTQLLKVEIDRTIVKWCLLAIVAIMIVNSSRLISFAHFPEHFEYLHNGTGRILFGWASTLATFALVGGGIVQATKARV